MGLGTPVVSYAPRPMSQAESFDEVIIDALSKMMLERNILVTEKRWKYICISRRVKS